MWTRISGLNSKFNRLTRLRRHVTPLGLIGCTSQELWCTSLFLQSGRKPRVSGGDEVTVGGQLMLVYSLGFGLGDRFGNVFQTGYLRFSLLSYHQRHNLVVQNTIKQRITLFRLVFRLVLNVHMFVLRFHYSKYCLYGFTYVCLHTVSKERYSSVELSLNEY